MITEPFSRLMLKVSQPLCLLHPVPCSFPALWSYGEDPVMRPEVSFIYVNTGRDLRQPLITAFYLLFLFFIVRCLFMDGEAEIESSSQQTSTANPAFQTGRLGLCDWVSTCHRWVPDPCQLQVHLSPAPEPRQFRVQYSLGRSPPAAGI